jgi:hypothetical protein
MRLACSGVQATSEKSPDLLPLMPLLPFSALSAGSGVALDVALDAVMALDVALDVAVLPRVFALAVGFSSPVALVASFLGTFRKVILEPDLSSVRLASIPAHASTGSTSLMRRHNQRADFGHALSRTIETPSSSAILSSFLCNSLDVTS